MNEQIIKVVACVIERDGKYLVGKRPLNKKHGGFWEFPGGKLEPEESLEDAAKRELTEELGVELASLESPITCLTDSHFEICFCPTQIKGEPKSIEHDEISWLTLKELAQIKLADLDQQFFKLHLSNIV